MLYLKLNEGESISEERYRYITDSVIFAKAKDRAYRFLGYKARTEKELRDKLSSDYSQEIVDRVVKVFKDYRYIDDEAYTKSSINKYTNLKPVGKRMMKYELLKKGIEESTVENIISNSDIDELDMAVKLLNKKIKNIENLDKKQKERAYSYLIRRGFDYDIVNRAFKIVLDLHNS